MSNYKDIFNQYDWDSLEKEIYSFSSKDVENVLEKDKINIDDFKVLISPAAKPFIEEMAQRSHRITKKRFGNTIQMYIPMYLSNECQNICTYCGFSMDNKIKRKTLTEKEIIKEAKYIKSLGYDHILLVTGEASKTVGVSYLKRAIQLVPPTFQILVLKYNLYFKTNTKL
jgi:2-iminoacetate synthase